MDFMGILKELLTGVSEAAISIVGRIVFAAIIYVVGRQLVKFVKRMFERSRAAKTLHESAVGFISSCINIVGNLMLVLTVVSVLGVPMTSIVALLGSAGLAIGLALQGGLSNFAGGVMILIFRPFDVGDYIVLSGVEGTVTKVSVFYTTLVTPDNRRIVVPNGTVSNETITNVSAEDERRLDVAVSVPTNADIETVREALLSVAREDGRVTEHEAPAARLVGYGAGCYNFELRVWCKKEVFWDLKFDLLLQIPERLAASGVGIAKNAVVVLPGNSEGGK